MRLWIYEKFLITSKAIAGNHTQLDNQPTLCKIRIREKYYRFLFVKRRIHALRGLSKAQMRFVQWFHRSPCEGHMKLMHLHKPQIPWPFVYVWQHIGTHLRETAWYFYKLPIIDRGEANCFQRGGRADLSPACPICTSNGKTVVADIAAKKPSEQSKASFALIVLRTYMR